MDCALGASDISSILISQMRLRMKSPESVTSACPKQAMVEKRERSLPCSPLFRIWIQRDQLPLSRAKKQQIAADMFRCQSDKNQKGTAPSCRSIGAASFCSVSLDGRTSQESTESALESHIRCSSRDRSTGGSLPGRKQGGVTPAVRWTRTVVILFGPDRPESGLAC